MGKLVTPADVLRSASATVSGSAVISNTALGDLVSGIASFAGSGDVSQIPRWTVTGNVTAIQGIKSDIDLSDDVINYQSGDVFSFPGGLPSGWSLLGATTLEYDGTGPEITQLTDFSVQRATFLPDIVSRVIATVVVQQVRPDAFGILKNDLFDSQVSPFSHVVTVQPVGANPPVVLTADDGSIEIDATNADEGVYFAEYELQESSVPAANNPARIDIFVSAFPEMPYIDALREMAYAGIGAATVAASLGGPSLDSDKTGAGTIWNGSSLLHRIAARGSVDIGAGNAFYGFNGNRTGLLYDNEMNRSTPYVKWECAHDPAFPNDFFVCIQSGVTGPSTPTLDKTTEEVSTTVDGTVIWAYAGNVVNDHSQQHTNWNDQGGDNQHIRLCHGQELNSFNAYFYDLSATALTWREYLIDRGRGTQDDIDILDWVGGLMIDHERARNRPDKYRARNEPPYNFMAHQLTTISQGWLSDVQATTPRYKGRGLLTTRDLQGVAVSGQFSGDTAFLSNGDAPMSTITNWHYNESAYDNATVMGENHIREVSYSFRNWVHFKTSEFIDTGVLDWPTCTVQNQITAPIPIPQFNIALLMKYLSDVMNGNDASSSSGGWAPFMKGLLFKTLHDYSELMISAGLDPNVHVSDAPLGGQYSWNWSTTQMHGICQPWPTIAAAMQDFLYWMRYTALAQDGTTKMFSAQFKDFQERTESVKYGTQARLEAAAVLNGQITQAYYYTGLLVQRGAPVIVGTHTNFTGWLTDADELWEGLIEYYSWFGTGKQTLETLSYAVSTIDIRNSITGRND